MSCLLLLSAEGLELKIASCACLFPDGCSSFLLILLFLFFSFSLHQSSRFHSLDHPTFPPVRLLALFIFPPFLSHSLSPEVPPSPPPPPFLSIFVFRLFCFLKCPPTPSPSPSPLFSLLLFFSLPSLAGSFSRSQSLFSPLASRLSSLSSHSSCFLPSETSALTAGCRTTRGFYPQFTSPRNEDDGRSRCRVQTLNEAIKRSL